MKNTFVCLRCKKETSSKNGIEGSASYFVTCKHCDAKHEIIQQSSGDGEPAIFTIKKLINL